MILPRTVLTPEQRRCLAVELVLDGGEPEQVAGLLNVSERSVWRWLSLFQDQGERGLLTRPGQGRPPKLSESQAQQVLDWLEQDATDFGFDTERWTAPRVAALIQQHFQVRMNHRYLNDWLGRHGITPQLPQPLPRERNEALIRGWIAHQWPRIKKR